MKNPRESPNPAASMFSPSQSNPAATIAAAIHKIQLALYEPPSPSSLTPDHLLTAALLLSRPDYHDVITERTISLRCGFPLCPNPLPRPDPSRRRPRFHISLSKHQVFDLQQSYNYCSQQCLISSRAFSETLNPERKADMRPSQVNEILSLFQFDRDSNLEKLENPSSLKILEREIGGGVGLDKWVGGPSNAVEGYVPRFDGTEERLRKTKDDFGNDDEARGSNGVLEEISKQLEKGVCFEEEDDIARNSSLRNGDGAKGSNDALEEITKQLEKRVSIEEEDDVARKSPKSSVYKLVTPGNNVAKQRIQNQNVDFSNDYGPQGSNAVMEEITKLLEEKVHFEEDNIARKSSKSSSVKLGTKGNNGESEMLSSTSSFGAVGDQFITAPASSAPKHQKQMDFTSTIIVGDKQENITSDELQRHPSKLGSDVHLQRCKQAAGQESKDSVAPKTDPKLKSSLKTSGERNVVRSVKWADEGERATHEEENNVLKSVKKAPLSFDEMIDGNLRFASAEACAAALTRASVAIASGMAEVDSAVSEAGIVILPQTQHIEVGDNEEDRGDDVFEFDHGYVKWPKKTVLLDTDMFEVEDSWHDTPPEGFNLNLSSFAMMWMALFEWISCSSLAYIYGHDNGLEDEFLFVNGKEYPRKIVLVDGKSSEIRQTIEGCMSRAMPGLVLDLKFPIPLSALEKKLGYLLDTMTFVGALPSFKFRQWQVIVLLFLEALSVNRLPSLTPHLTNRDMLLHKVLKSADVKSEEYETMRDLIMPLGRFPDLSMQRGG